MRPGPRFCGISHKKSPFRGGIRGAGRRTECKRPVQGLARPSNFLARENKTAMPCILLKRATGHGHLTPLVVAMPRTSCASSRDEQPSYEAWKTAAAQELWDRHSIVVTAI